MPNSFHYSAWTYLDQWLTKDESFHLVLKFEARETTSPTDGASALAQFATYYGVARTLPIIDETPRLLAAYKALCEIEPPTEDDVVTKVQQLETHLLSLYDRPGASRKTGSPLSAASKFLWIRFRTPVIIYDSLTTRYLAKHGYKCDGYAGFYGDWIDEYARHEQEIREACAALIGVKHFTWASERSDQDLGALVNSPWFMRGVLDHYMQNAPGAA